VSNRSSDFKRGEKMTQEYTIIHYEENGRDIVDEWIDKLRDKVGKRAIDRRILQMGDGNFGDHKFCRDEVWELRIHVNAGYRVYYSISGNKIILLLCGGSKRTQQKDIDNAVEYLKKFKER